MNTLKEAIAKLVGEPTGRLTKQGQVYDQYPKTDALLQLLNTTMLEVIPKQADEFITDGKTTDERAVGWNTCRATIRQRLTQLTGGKDA